MIFGCFIDFKIVISFFVSLNLLFSEVILISFMAIFLLLCFFSHRYIILKSDNNWPFYSRGFVWLLRRFPKNIFGKGAKQTDILLRSWSVLHLHLMTRKSCGKNIHRMIYTSLFNLFMCINIIFFTNYLIKRCVVKSYLFYYLHMRSWSF